MKKEQEIKQTDQGLGQPRRTVPNIIPLDQVFAAFGGLKAEETELIISGGIQHYWPAIKDAMLSGVLENRFVIGTTYGEANMYEITLTSEAQGVDTQTGELTTLNPGQTIHVLERTVLRKLQKYIGNEVGIICDGIVPSKRNRGQTVWVYRAVKINREIKS